MTRQDYELIASVIKDARNLAVQSKVDPTPETLARMFADRLASTNARFDRARFLRAAGV